MENKEIHPGFSSSDTTKGQNDDNISKNDDTQENV